MKRRSLLLTTLAVSAVSFPALAFAFGGPGNCAGPMGGPMGGMGGSMGGPRGNLAMMSQAVAATTVDLGRALEAARGVASGVVSHARLVPVTPSAEARSGNAFTTPPLSPAFLITLRDKDKDSRTVVVVDGVTGKATVAGTATGLLAEPGGLGPRGDKTWSGGWSGRHGRGGPFGPPTDLSAAKIDAAQALAIATKATPEGKAVMVRGMERDGDKAWAVGIARPGARPTEGKPAESTDSTPPSAPPGGFTMVYVDPQTGALLNSLDVLSGPGFAGPGMAPN